MFKPWALASPLIKRKGGRYKSVFVSPQGISKQVLCVMKAVAGNDDVKVAICKAGGIELILNAVSKHQRSAVVCETGCAALATLALRQLEHGQRIMDSNGPEVIVKAMQLHPTEAGLQVELGQLA